MTHDRHSSDRHSSSVEIPEADAVEAVVRDYIDGWHFGDAKRMDRCLHNDLVKRSNDDEAAVGDLMWVTKTQMVQLTRDGGGRSPDAAAEIVVHHVEDGIASAHVATEQYLDYLHLSKTTGAWRIVHDLFRHRV